MLAYDDEYSIKYFRQNLRPYWRRNGDDAAALLKTAAADYESLRNRCEAFDAKLMEVLRKIGGEKYAQLCALAYRQTFAGNKIIADAKGQPLMFPKENFSNGCIGTVDVLFPQAPFFLVFSPALTKAMLVPILDYAASPRWPYGYAPHDLGTYPPAGRARSAQDFRVSASRRCKVWPGLGSGAMRRWKASSAARKVPGRRKRRCRSRNRNISGATAS